MTVRVQRKNGPTVPFARTIVLPSGSTPTRRPPGFERVVTPTLPRPEATSPTDQGDAVLMSGNEWDSR